MDEDYATIEDNLIVDYMGTAADGLTPVLLPEGEWLKSIRVDDCLSKPKKGLYV